MANDIKRIACTNIKIKSLMKLLDCSDIGKIDKLDTDALHYYCELIVDMTNKISGYTSNLNQSG